jgi:hypothetical protein
MGGQLMAPKPLLEEGAIDWPLLQTHRNLLGEQKVQGLLTVLRDSILQHREALREAIDADDFTEIAPGPPFGGQRRLLGFRAWPAF